MLNLKLQLAYLYASGSSYQWILADLYPLLHRGDSGELSVVTSALNVAGFVARTFTHLVLTKDMLNLTGSTVLGLLNVYIFHQTLVTAGVYGKCLSSKNIDKSSA